MKICVPILITLLTILTSVNYGCAQENYRLDGKIIYKVYVGKPEKRIYSTDYIIHFNKDVMRYKVEHETLQERLRMIATKNVSEVYQNLDSIELKTEVQKYLKQVESAISKNYVFFDKGLVGSDFEKNGEKYFGLDTIKRKDSIDVALTEDTATILGIKCQKYMVTTPKITLYYWVTTSIPISINHTGFSRLPGVSLRIENKDNTAVYEAVLLEYPTKDIVSFSLDPKKVVSRKTALQIQSDAIKEVQAENKNSTLRKN